MFEYLKYDADKITKTNSKIAIVKKLARDVKKRMKALTTVNTHLKQLTEYEYYPSSLFIQIKHGSTQSTIISRFHNRIC